MTKTTLPPPEQYARRLFDDFDFFIEELWRDRNLHKVAPLGDVERDIADYAANGPRYRGILASRGLGKTHIVTASLTCYRLLRDPNRKILIVSKSETEAKKTLKLIRDWLRMVPFLKHLEPQSANKRDGANRLDVEPAKEDRQPSVTAIGIDGQLEGNRAHTIIPDDTETHTNTKTRDARDMLAARLGEFKSILYPDRPYEDGGPIDSTEVVVVGTYHHEESVYKKLPDRGYEFRTWPIAYPAADEETLNLAPMLAERLKSGKVKPGDPTMPHRFGVGELNVRRAEGRTYWGMQYMLLSNLGDALRYPLRLSDLIVMALNRDMAPAQVVWGERDHNGTTEVPDIQNLGFLGDKIQRPAFISKDWLPYTGTKAGLDPAGRGADKTGLAIVSHLNGMLFLKCLKGLPGGMSDEAIDEQILLLRKHNAREVYIERNIDAFGAFEETFRSRLPKFFIQPGADRNYPEGWRCVVDVKHAKGQKEVRIIETVEPVTSTHRLVVDPSCLRPCEAQMQDEFQYQFTRLTRERNCLAEDGKMDALEIAVDAWLHTLSQDPQAAYDRAEAERKRRDMEESLADYGVTVTEPRWFTHR